MRQLPVKENIMNLTGAATIIMTPAEVAVILQLSEKELRTMRLANKGPAFYALGGRLIRYNRADVHRWQANHAPATPPR